MRLLTTGREIMMAVLVEEAQRGLGFDFARDPALRVLANGAGRLGPVMATDHPLASRALLGLNDCVDYPRIFADESMSTRPYLDEALAGAMINCELSLESNSIEVMRHSAMLEQAITFLTPFDIEWEKRAGR